MWKGYKKIGGRESKRLSPLKDVEQLNTKPGIFSRVVL